MDKKSKCCSCSYEWTTGTDGDHSCVVELKKNIKVLTKSYYDDCDVSMNLLKDYVKLRKLLDKIEKLIEE